MMKFFKRMNRRVSAFDNKLDNQIIGAFDLIGAARAFVDASSAAWERGENRRPG